MLAQISEKAMCLMTTVVKFWEKSIKSQPWDSKNSGCAVCYYLINKTSDTIYIYLLKQINYRYNCKEDLQTLSESQISCVIYASINRIVEPAAPLSNSVELKQNNIQGMQDMPAASCNNSNLLINQLNLQLNRENCQQSMYLENMD